MAHALTSDLLDEPPAAEAPSPSREMELKLELDPADLDAIATAPIVAGALGDRREQHSVYFDTPARALRHAGLSLRVRRIAERRIQTLKAESGASAGLFVRPEWERDIDGDRPIVNDFAAPLQALIAADELAALDPAFELTVDRRVARIETEGTGIELALDAGTMRAGGREAPVCEIELELLWGEPARLFDVARILADHAPLRLGVLSKSERGYRLLEGDGDKPLKSQAVRLTPAMTAADGFQAIARACLRQFRVNEAILLRTGNASALHQARVALRRLRSALSIFRGIVADDHFEHLRSELKWIAAELGEARNIDVLIARLPSKRAAKPLRAARDVAYEHVGAALGSERARTLVIDLVEWIALGGWLTDAAGAPLRDEPLPAFAGQMLEKFRRRVKRRGRDLATQSDEARHRVRIEAKKLRYATEFFTELYDKPKAKRRHAAFLAALEDLQTHLGDLNDLATEPEVLARLGLIEGPAVDALSGSHQSHAALVVKAADAHAALIDAKRFWN